MMRKSEDKITNDDRATLSSLWMFKPGSVVLLAATMLSGCAATRIMSPMPPRNSTIRAETAEIQAFDKEATMEFYSKALLPSIYADALEAKRSPAEAKQLVRDRLPENVDFSVLKRGRVVCVILNDTNNRTVTIAFNPNDLGFNSDLVNNWKAWSKPHPLGGRVHAGYDDELMHRDKNGISLYEDAASQVEKYVAGQASEHGKKVNIEVMGGSRGGTLAEDFLARALAEGIAMEKTGKSLGGIPSSDFLARTVLEGLTQEGKARFTSDELFMPVALGDKVFSQKFVKEAERRGIRIEQVSVVGDYAKNYMLGKFFHVGNDIELVTDNAHGSLQRVLINPDQKELKMEISKMPKWFPTELPRGPFVHDHNVMAKMLGVRGTEPEAQASSHGEKIKRDTLSKTQTASNDRR